MKLNDLVNKLIATNANGKKIRKKIVEVKVLKEAGIENYILEMSALEKNKELLEYQVVSILDIFYQVNTYIYHGFESDKYDLYIEVLVK